MPQAVVSHGRLALLADLSGRLAEAPDRPETFRSVVDTVRAGTLSDAAELKLGTGADQQVFTSGSVRGRARKLSLRIRDAGATLGEIAVWRENGYHDADRLFLETVCLHLGEALRDHQMRNAERGGVVDDAPAFSRIRKLFGGRVGRAIPSGSTPRRGGGQLVSLSDDLVTLARVEVAGDLRRVRLTAADLVRSCTLKRLERADASGHALLLLGAAEDLAVVGDRHHLEIALDHLLANALAYSPVGTAVGVSAERIGDEIHLRVDDEGPGVAQAEREKIFDRFYRGRSAIIAELPGNGLGLTVVAQVAAAHGGRAFWEASPAGGSRFVLALPAA